jgi:hypothetical protein
MMSLNNVEQYDLNLQNPSNHELKVINVIFSPEY